MSKIKCNCSCHQPGSNLAHIKPCCVNGYIDFPDTPSTLSPEIGEGGGKNNIPSQEENPTGFHRRYKVSKVSGEPIDKGAEYIVLRLDWGGDDKEHIRAGRIGAVAYASAIAHHLPDVAKDLKARYTDLEDGQVHIQLENGATARVSQNPSPELVNAITAMVDLAKKMPTETPTTGEGAFDFDKWVNEKFDERGRYKQTLDEWSHYKCGVVDMYNDLWPINRSLRQEITQLKEALQEIEDPTSFIQKRADKEGKPMDGQRAFALSFDPVYLKGIATLALKQFLK